MSLVLPMIQISMGETACGFGVKPRGPGTYTRALTITNGCALRSSLFISAIDPGATITAIYTDTTTGNNYGESITLGTHGPFDDTLALPYTDQKIITGYHNKPIVDIVVTGGSVTFGLYLTVCEAGFTFEDGVLLVKSPDTQTNVVQAPPTIKWIQIVAPNVEQSYVLPAGTKRFQLINRSNKTINFAYEAGKSAAQVPITDNEYWPLDPFTTYGEEELTGAITFYFRGPNVGLELVVKSWQA